MTVKTTIRPRETSKGVVWQVRYRHDGKQRSKTFTSERDAQRAAALLRTVGHDQWTGMLARTAPDVRVHTLTDVLQHYLDHHDARPGTIAEYRAVATRTWLRSLGPIPVHAITREMVVQWVKTEDAAGRASKTIGNAHGILSSVMLSAVERGVITTNPCRGVRMPKHETDEREFLSRDDFAALVAELPAWYRPFVIVLGGTGMRWGEATSLQWRDLDLHSARLHIRRAWHRNPGQGFTLEAPKTRRSRRTLTLAPSLLHQLHVAKEQAVNTTRDAFVFTTPGGAVIRHSNFIPRIWHKARGAAGLPEKVTPHVLRHSYVAWAVSGGMSLPVIQHRLGHESIRVTIDRYGHLLPDVIAEADALTETIVGGFTPPAIAV